MPDAGDIPTPDRRRIQPRDCQAPAARTPRRRSTRKILFALHSWAGFQLTLLTFVVLLSGSLAVVGDEIDWLLDSDRRIEAFNGDPAWSAMLATARARFPEQRLEALTLGELPVMAAQARFRLADDERRRLFLHPEDGRALGEGHWLSAQRLLRDFHRYLFIMPGGLGLPLVTIAAIVLALQLVTGLATVRKWARGLVTLRAGRGVRVLIGDLHRSGGLWTFWFTLLIVVTSFWYLAEWVLHSAGGRAAAPIAAVSEPTGPAPDLLPLGTYIDAAAAVYPGFRARGVLLPDERRAQVVVTGRSQDWLVRDRAARVTLDGSTARVLAVQRPESLSPLQYVADLADPWHFGDVGGLATKLLWFACGLVLTALAGTGTWLTWRRTGTGVTRWHALCSGVLTVSALFGASYIGHYLG